MMAFAFAARPDQPLSELNTTPLIDVLLVLLVVFVMSITLATHAIEIELPRPEIVRGPVNPVRNMVVLTTSGAIRWNGMTVSEAQLVDLLRETRRLPVEPELQFQPDGDASYDRTARLLKIFKAVGVTKLGFTGNERYRQFGR